ncbi:hypothetical protein KFE25_014426 [Diacronema lutheri]|uniref:F5/8 type C domain-containing protein n=1 Tax=Diacronema lutheri TaxID=2081491 RepID=A0A8J6C9X1_DIALT|nr:hypothetical protein KFE25_014426 [Diacronema lutheri]
MGDDDDHGHHALPASYVRPAHTLDPSHRFACMRGATARRVRSGERARALTLESSGADAGGGLIFVTTAEEEYGLFGCTSMNKRRRWEAVASLLAGSSDPVRLSGDSRRARSAAIGARRSVRLELDLPVTGMLQPVGAPWLSARRAILAASHGKIFSLHDVEHVASAAEWARLLRPARSGAALPRLRPLYVRPDGPPDGLRAGSSLLEQPAVRLRAIGVAGTACARRATVHSRHDDNRSAYCPARPRGASADAPCAGCFEVDLGAACVVTHVSTRGRFPVVRLFPTSQALRAWDPTGNSPWTQLPPPLRGLVLPVAAPSEQWTSRYRVLARADGGRAWVSLGVFAGNVDGTSEVAHAVSHGREPVRARFVRFEPLAWHGDAPALRVGVYGRRLDAPTPTVDGASATPASVRYTLCGGALEDGRLFDAARRAQLGTAADDDDARAAVRSLGRYTRHAYSRFRSRAYSCSPPARLRGCALLDVAGAALPQWQSTRRDAFRAACAVRGCAVRDALCALLPSGDGDEVRGEGTGDDTGEEGGDATAVPRARALASWLAAARAPRRAPRRRGGRCRTGRHSTDKCVDTHAVPPHGNASDNGESDDDEWVVVRPSAGLAEIG